MRNLYELDKYRLVQSERHRYGMPGNSKMGVFIIPGDPVLRIIADSGEGWDHVSVSTEYRTPTWEEMDKVKRLFFKDDEVAFQFHVTPEDHINIHPNRLHLWRPTFKRIPLPKSDRV